MPYFPNNVHNKSSNKMSSNTSLDNTSDQDYSEFLSEYLLQTNSPSHEPEIHYEEGEMEAEWLIAAGFPQLTKPFEQGLELRTSELEPILATLSKPHAEAIKQRVRALNHTVRGRTKNRQNRKPDIRDVFRDVDESSTGTRSRSATPDSLDSIHGDADEVWGNASIPSFVSIFDHHTNATDRDDNPLSLQLGKQLKQRLRRTPSAPLKGATDIFRGSHVRCDIPMDSADGIELLGFSRIGTLHLPRNRSGSDPAVSLGRSHGQVMQQDSHSDNNTLSSDSSDECLSNTGARLSNLSNPESSPQNILNKINLDTPPQSVQNSPSRDCISFSNMIRESSSQDGVDTIDSSDNSLEICSDIDTMNETDLKRLQPIFWLELASIFDRNHVTFDKRKPFKRRRKEEGNLFGVSLNALIRRDQQIIGTDSTLVPIFLECLLEQLIVRGSREVGILRIAGHKQKTELLYAELESSFYQKPKKFAQIFATTNVHDLCALLKRWLRELPQPLLSSELIQLFYQCHALPPSDQSKALSIICQMLPHENRNTLRRLLRFFNSVIENKELNKMNEHNVATMIAPSLFPPRYIHPRNKNSIEEQVQMAAHCCRLTNTLITRGELLFQVPNNLIEESKLTNKTRQGKRGMHRRVKATTSLLHVTNNNNNNISNNNNNNNKNNNNLSKNSATTVAAAATTAANIVVITSNNAAGGVSAGGVGNAMGTNTKTLLSRQQSVNPSHVHRLII